MKNLIPVLFILLFTNSCEDKSHYYCWDCTMTIYGKTIKDVYCHQEITEVEAYKLRLYDFYAGGCTNIDCTLKPEPGQ